MALGDGIARNKGRKGYAFQKGYNTAIKEMQGNLISNSRTEIIDGEICLIVTDKRIKQIAEMMLFKQQRRMSMMENEVLESALEKVKAQKINFGFMERFNVDENWEVMKALEEIQQYRAIGTIEELQALKEKAEPKKPIDISRVRDNDGYIGLIGKCPCCDDIVEEDTLYCEDCGQKLDWSEKE